MLVDPKPSGQVASQRTLKGQKVASPVSAMSPVRANPQVKLPVPFHVTIISSLLCLLILIMSIVITMTNSIKLIVIIVNIAVLIVSGRLRVYMKARFPCAPSAKAKPLRVERSEAAFDRWRTQGWSNKDSGGFWSRKTKQKPYLNPKP